MTPPQPRRRSALAVAGALALSLLLLPLAGCATGPDQSRPWAAATVAAAPADLPDDPAALAVLRRAAQAEATLSYQGVTSCTAPDGGPMVQRSIVHTPGAGTEVASARGALSLVPDHQPVAGLPGSLLLVDLLGHRFAVVSAGTTTLLARSVDLVEARDATGRVLGRFWLDHATGLLLRRDLLDPASGTERTAAFDSITIPARVPAPAAAATSAPTSLDAAAVARLRAEGWVAPEGLPGGLTLVQADEAASGAVQLVYSDGLELISLFVQRGRLDPASMPGLGPVDLAGGQVLRSRAGTPTWVWQTSGSVVTLISDAPTALVERVVSALPPDN